MRVYGVISELSDKALEFFIARQMGRTHGHETADLLAGMQRSEDWDGLLGSSAASVARALSRRTRRGKFASLAQKAMSRITANTC